VAQAERKRRVARSWQGALHHDHVTRQERLPVVSGSRVGRDQSRRPLANNRKTSSEVLQSLNAYASSSARSSPRSVGRYPAAARAIRKGEFELCTCVCVLTSSARGSAKRVVLDDDETKKKFVFVSPRAPPSPRQDDSRALPSASHARLRVPPGKRQRQRQRPENNFF